MAANNEITTTGTTYLGIESTYNSTPTMTRVFPRRGGTRKEAQPAVPVETLTTHTEVREPSVLAYKSCESSIPFDARVHATLLNDAAGTPTRSWLGVPLAGVLGGESLHAGSKIIAGSTATVLKVTATQGARFNVLDGILVTVAGVNEFAVIKSIAGDDLTLMFALSAVPSVGADVFACAAYFPKDQHSDSLTFQHARAQNANSQWTHNGCTGSLALDLPRGGMVGLTFNLQGASWTGPSAQGIDATSPGSQTMSAPFANVRALQILQPISTTTRVHVPFESISIGLDCGMSLIEDVGGNEGRVGPMRTSFAASADIVLRNDPAWRSSWDPSTVYQLVHCVYQGSGTARRAVAAVLFGTLDEIPDYQPGPNDRGLTQLKFRGFGGAANPSATTDQARAQFLWMMG